MDMPRMAHSEIGWGLRAAPHLTMPKQKRKRMRWENSSNGALPDLSVDHQCLKTHFNDRLVARTE